VARPRQIDAEVSRIVSKTARVGAVTASACAMLQRSSALAIRTSSVCDHPSLVATTASGETTRTTIGTRPLRRSASPSLFPARALDDVERSPAPRAVNDPCGDRAAPTA
jgi:hypothetical protein